MTTDVLYKQSYKNRLGEINKLAPEAAKAFGQFDQKAMAEGVLPTKLKELIAVAVAHVTGCPYCIDIHVKNLKKLEGSKEEMAESIMVATALKAGSAYAHSINALDAYDEVDGDSLYAKGGLKNLAQLNKVTPEINKAFQQFDAAAMQEGALTTKEKEIIAVAIAHVTGCPYCIEIHTGNAKKMDVTKEEIAESIFVATTLKAGSAYAHGINALNAYDE